MKVNLFKPYPAQRNVIDGYATSEHLFGVVVSPRGSGKTLLAINLMLFWLLKNNGSKGGLISPIYNQAKASMEIISKTAFELIKSQNKAELSIEFINGSTLKFLSADRADSVRGFRFEYLILDEVAYMKKDSIESAIIPTLNPNGRKCLMISTPRSKNHFYEYYLRGQQGENDIISYKIRLDECPYVKTELIEEAKKSLPADVFRAEYEAEFTDSTNDVFIGFSKNCNLNVWDTNTRDRCYFGIDTGLANDYSTLTIITEGGRVAFMDRVNQLSLDEIAKRFITKLKSYNVVNGFVEANGIGAGMLELIKREVRETKAFHTNQDNKMTAIRQLMADLDSGFIELPTRDLMPVLYDEMSSYTYKYSANGKISFTHPAGLHDDLLDSLWLANHARNELKNSGKKAIFIGGATNRIYG